MKVRFMAGGVDPIDMTVKHARMKIVPLLVLVLGSQLLIPVSCTVAFFAGIQALPYLSARDVARGDRPYLPFWVVAEPGVEGNRFQWQRLNNGSSQDPSPGVHSYLMSEPEGRVEIDTRSSVAYRVLEDQGERQRIEVEYLGGGIKTWSVYTATRRQVLPETSRMIHFTWPTVMFVWAFGVALLLRRLGRTLRRRRGAGGRQTG
jgi:hypothetical protein